MKVFFVGRSLSVLLTKCVSPSESRAAPTPSRLLSAVGQWTEAAQGVQHLLSRNTSSLANGGEMMLVIILIITLRGVYQVL